MLKQKIIKFVVVPVAGIFILVAYYNVNSKGTGKSASDDLSPIMAAPELDASALAVEKKTKKEAYDEALEEQERKKAEWQRIQATNANQVASDFSQVLKENNGYTGTDYNQQYRDSVAQAEAIRKKILVEMEVEEETQSDVAPTPVKKTTRRVTTTKPKYVVKQPEPEPEPELVSVQQAAPVATTSGFNTVSVSNHANTTTSSEVTNLRKVSIKAVVFGEHKIKSGEAVRIRTKEDAIVNGYKIPRNTVFNAISTGRGNRLMVEIENIQGIQVDMQVFDTDNMAGINVPYDFGRDQVSEGTGDVVNDATRNYTTTNRSITGSVVQAVAGSLNNATREYRVNIPDGYEIVIK